MRQFEQPTASLSLFNPNITNIKYPIKSVPSRTDFLFKLKKKLINMFQKLFEN
jgi:hypothetical protein